jgi:trimethylamine--corrinoid protein Co-methyltransferase
MFKKILVPEDFNDLAARPFVIPYLNPISPLVINAGTADKLFATVERGLPVIYSNYGMAGASTPMTPAGTLALMNAELLGGLVLSQAIREGTPVVLGSLPAFFDMKGMGPFYDPVSMVINLACAEVMAYYRLPHCGSSGSGSGWGPDLPGAGMHWLNHLTSCIGKVGLAPFVGGNLGSLVFSPTSAMYSHEIIGQARQFAAGFRLDNDSVGLEEMAQVGPGGDFLTAPLTLKLFRRATYRSDIFPRLSLEAWRDQGRPQAVDLLRRRTREAIEQARTPEDHDQVMEVGEAFIHNHTSGR